MKTLKALKNYRISNLMVFILTIIVLTSVSVKAKTINVSSIASLKSENEEDNIDSNIFHLYFDDLKTYARSTTSSDLLIKNTLDYNNNNKTGISIILGTDSSKPYLADLMSKLEKDNNIDSTIGVIASSVTNLHIPRLLFSSYETNHKKIEKHISGVIGLVLRGNIEIQTIAVLYYYYCYNYFIV
jgi:hypothetical protein